MVDKVMSFNKAIKTFTEDHLQNVPLTKAIEKISMGCKNLKEGAITTFTFKEAYGSPPRVFVWSNFYSIDFAEVSYFQKYKATLKKYDRETITVAAPKVSLFPAPKNAKEMTGSVCYVAIDQGEIDGITF